MPKKGARGGKGGKGGGRQTSKARDVGLPAELEEDVDRYVEGRNKIMMGRVRGESEDEEEDEERGQVILGLREEEDSDEESSEEESGSDVGELKKGLESDEEEKGEEGWGKKKSDYYDVDDMEDSEAEEEEEKEAMKIRAKQSASLKSADWGEDEVIEEEEEEETLGKRSESSEKKIKKKMVPKAGKASKPVQQDAWDDDDVEEEKVERDLSGLSAADRMEILANDAPELPSLLSDLRRYLTEVKTKLIPLSERAKKGQIASEEGAAYIETKMGLLVNYCTSVSLYLMFRAEGRLAKNHPVMEQLVEFRGMLELMQPLDDKLKGEVEELLSLPEGEVPTRAPTVNGTSRAGANGKSKGVANGKVKAATFNDSDDEDDDEFDDEDDAGKDGEEEDDVDDEMDEASLVAAMQEKYKELMAQDTSSSGARKRQHTQRDEFKDDDVSGNDEHTPAEPSKRKKLKAGVNFQTYNDFGDQDDAVDGDADKLALKFNHKRSLKEMVHSQDQARTAKRQNAKEESGEVDVPVRDRRQMIQQVAERKQRMQAKLIAAERDRKEAGGEDDKDEDYYKQVKANKLAKKEERKAKREAERVMDYVEEATVELGKKRQAGRTIVSNRGLVPHRSKEKKNPRVKHRKRFEKKKIKERTSFYGKQVREDRGAYGGESTGIKANIARSRKL